MRQHESCGKNPAAEEERSFLFSFFLESFASGCESDASAAAAAASLVKNSSKTHNAC